MGFGSILKKGLKAVGGVLGGPVGSAAVSALGGIAGSLIGKKSQDNTNQQQMDLAKYQYEKNLEMWNKQNEYNTPSAQMQRYQEAGLNPNLIYNSGTAVSGNASNSPTYQAPQLKAFTDYGDFGASNAVSAYNAFRQTTINQAMTDSNIGLNNLKGDVLAAQALRTLAETKNLTFDYKWKTNTEGLRYQELQKNIDLLGQRIGLTAAQNQRIGHLNNIAIKQLDIMDQSLYNMKMQGKLTEQQYENAKLTATEITNRYNLLYVSAQEIQYRLDTNPPKEEKIALNKALTELETEMYGLKKSWNNNPYLGRFLFFAGETAGLVGRALGAVNPLLPKHSQ